MNEKIILVDDDNHILTSVSVALRNEGWQVETYPDGEKGLIALQKNIPDLVILDIKMPRIDGMEMLKRLRISSNVPVIFLTSKDEEIDEALGLRMGADDYITKPFSQKLLIERIRAVLRRSSGKLEEKETESSRLVFNDFELDLNAHSLSRGGEKVSLTSGEFDLLALLAANPNRVLHRDTILDKLTGAERSPFDRSIDVRVTRLRGKLEFDPSKPELIKTIWGKGYMFCPS